VADEEAAGRGRNPGGATTTSGGREPDGHPGRSDGRGVPLDNDVATASFWRHLNCDGWFSRGRVSSATGSAASQSANDSIGARRDRHRDSSDAITLRGLSSACSRPGEAAVVAIPTTLGARDERLASTGLAAQPARSSARSRRVRSHRASNLT